VPAPKPLAVGDSVPDAVFVDQRGRSVALSSLRGRAYALTFIYTRCQDAQMCPLISAKYHQVEPKLPAGTMLVEVTLDPSYDRPPVLAKYATTFGAQPDRWLLLTGTPPGVIAFAQRFGIYEERANAQTIVHTERLAVVDRSGKIASFFEDPAWTPQQLLAALGAVR
jgi:protein SCO1/2